jgi:hypothetical protein
VFGKTKVDPEQIGLIGANTGITVGGTAFMVTAVEVETHPLVVFLTVTL